MAWLEFGIYKDGAYSPQDLHVLNVYKDPEFLEDIAKVFPKNRNIFVEVQVVRTSVGKDSNLNAREIKLQDLNAFLELLPKLNYNQKQQALKILDLIETEELKRLVVNYSISVNDVWMMILVRFGLDYLLLRKEI